LQIHPNGVECKGWDDFERKERQLESLNLESAELTRIFIIAVILLSGLGLLKLTLKLATRVLMLGCLGIVIVLAVLIALGVMS
jgi:hypothetical protein